MHTALRVFSMLLVIGSVTAAPAARAQDGPFEARVRGEYLNATTSGQYESSTVFNVANTSYAELDAEWCFARNLSVELAVTYSQTLALASGYCCQTFQAQPLLLTAKYDFTPIGRFRPYVGVGVDRTVYSDVLFFGSLDSASTRAVAQAGVDIVLYHGLRLNLDVKYAQMRTDYLSLGVPAAQLRIDPLLIGLGLGWRFCVTVARAASEAPCGAERATTSGSPPGALVGPSDVSARAVRCGSCGSRS
jgi:outer membrane protein